MHEPQPYIQPSFRIFCFNIDCPEEWGSDNSRHRLLQRWQHNRTHSKWTINNQGHTYCPEHPRNS